MGVPRHRVPISTWFTTKKSRPASAQKDGGPKVSFHFRDSTLKTHLPTVLVHSVECSGLLVLSRQPFRFILGSLSWGFRRRFVLEWTFRLLEVSTPLVSSMVWKSARSNGWSITPMSRELSVGFVPGPICKEAFRPTSSTTSASAPPSG